MCVCVYLSQTVLISSKTVTSRIVVCRVNSGGKATRRLCLQSPQLSFITAHSGRSRAPGVVIPAGRRHHILSLMKRKTHTYDLHTHTFTHSQDWMKDEWLQQQHLVDYSWRFRSLSRRWYGGSDVSLVVTYRHEPSYLLHVVIYILLWGVMLFAEFCVLYLVMYAFVFLPPTERDFKHNSQERQRWSWAVICFVFFCFSWMV